MLNHLACLFLTKLHKTRKRNPPVANQSSIYGGIEVEMTCYNQRFSLFAFIKGPRTTHNVQRESVHFSLVCCCNGSYTSKCATKRITSERLFNFFFPSPHCLSIWGKIRNTPTSEMEKDDGKTWWPPRVRRHKTRIFPATMFFSSSFFLTFIEGRDSVHQRVELHSRICRVYISLRLPRLRDG